MPKHLFLCRHAHTREATHPQKDFERTLTQAGLAEADQAGAFIAAFNLQPDLFICSAAVRTRQTAEIIARKINFDPQNINVSPELYLTTATELRQTLTQLPQHVNVVILMGHNPAVSEVASQLINNHRRQLPTGGCCYFTFAEDEWLGLEWADINFKLSF